MKHLFNFFKFLEKTFPLAFPKSHEAKLWDELIPLSKQVQSISTEAKIAKIYKSLQNCYEVRFVHTEKAKDKVYYIQMAKFCEESYKKHMNTFMNLLSEIEDVKHTKELAH